MSDIAPNGASSGRRYDMDWLRLGALGLLIIYHVLCVFDGRPWVIKSDFAGPWADGFVALLTPWRMSLVFLVGGVASRFLLEKLDTFEFVVDRVRRLIVPFVIAVILLAPPQIYVQLLEAGRMHNGFLHFWYYQAWSVVNYHGLRMPAFEHAWFLPYLFAYAVAAAFAWPARRNFEALRRVLERTPVWTVAAAFMALFAFVDAVVAPVHGPSVLVFTDVTDHLRFAPVFFLGFAVARSDVFWARIKQSRGLLCALALTFGAASIVMLQVTGPIPAGLALPELIALRGFFGGAMLLAVVSLALGVLNKPSAALSYGTDAILPIYLLHQTVLVLAAHYSQANHWPVPLEFLFLIIVSVGVSLGLYHFVIRNTPALRVMFGLRSKRRSYVAPMPASMEHQAA